MERCRGELVSKAHRLSYHLTLGSRVINKEKKVTRGGAIREEEASFFFFTLVTGPRRSLSLKLSDARVYEPHIRALLVTMPHFCEVVNGNVDHYGLGSFLSQVPPPCEAVPRRARI